MSNLAFNSQLHLYMKNDVLLNLWNGWSDGEKSRPWNELWLVVDGGAKLTVGDKEYNLKKGDFCMLPDVLPKAHNCDRFDHFEVWVIQFEGFLVTGSLFKQFSCSDWVVSLSDEEFGKIEEIFVRSANRGTYAMPFEELLRANRDLYILTEAFFSKVELIKLQKSDWLSGTLSYISGHLDQKLTIELLAGRVAMHPKHFTRCFHERVGEPPGKYITKARLEKATSLLVKGTPIAEISELIGFQSTQQFFRFFKQHTGMTPRAYCSYIKGGKT